MSILGLSGTECSTSWSVITSHCGRDKGNGSPEVRENEQDFGSNSRSTDYFSERSDNAGPVQDSQDTKTNSAETRAVIATHADWIDAAENTAGEE